MYGLAVNLIVSVSGHPWIIDEIIICTFVDLGQSEKFSEIMQPLSPVGSHLSEFLSDSF